MPITYFRLLSLHIFRLQLPPTAVLSSSHLNRRRCCCSDSIAAGPSFSGKYRRKKVLTIIRISRKEKDYLAANGVCQGPGGDIHHTVARHRRTYYMTESENAENLLSQYRRSVTICSCQKIQ